jgi:PiT family inorganic phosphate transporter/sodium-dependent phosphate transporter
VGLCNGTWRTINWRMVAWIYMGWIITLPVTGIISGCLVGIIVNAPRWGLSYGSGEIPQSVLNATAAAVSF